MDSHVLSALEKLRGLGPHLEPTGSRREVPGGGWHGAAQDGGGRTPAGQGRWMVLAAGV